MRKLTWRPTILAATASMLLAGCGAATAGSPDRPPTSVTLPPGTSQAFELIDFASYEALENAITTWTTSCVQRKGYSPPQQGGGERPQDAILQTRESFGPITEEEARRQGLHTGPVPDPDDVKRLPPNADAGNAFSDCYNEALGKIGDVRKVEGDFLAYVDGATNKLYAGMRADVEKAMISERNCAAKSGWNVAPGQRLDDVSASSANVFGVQTASDTLDANGQAIGYTPLPKEVDLALALMNCRVTLGNPDRLLSRAKTVEAEVVGGTEAQLRELNSQMSALAKAAPGKLA